MGVLANMDKAEKAALKEQQIKEFVELMEKHNPKTKHDIEVFTGRKLTDISDHDGAYRDVYSVSRLPLVVKIPRNVAYQAECIHHSQQEINTIKRIKRGHKKYSRLQQFMPELFYGNTKTGIIVMRKYKKPSWSYSKHVISYLLREIVELFYIPSSMGDHDVSSANIAFKESGDPVIIDFGYFD